MNLVEKSLIDLDSDDQLYSTLSPRVKPSNKIKRPNKKTTVLTSKKYFRRSSIYEKSIPTEFINSLSIIEISSSDSSFENTKNDSYDCAESKNKTPLVSNIFPRKVNGYYTPENKSDGDFISPSPINDEEVKCLSTTKKQITSIDSRQFNRTVKTKLFEIKKDVCNDKNLQFSQTSASFLGYEDFEKRAINGNSTVITEDLHSADIYRHPRDESTDDSSEEILNNLYGGSWKLRKEYVLPESAKKKIHESKNSKKKLTKYDMYKNPFFGEKLESDILVGELQTKITKNIKSSSLKNKPIYCEEDKENIESKIEQHSFNCNDEMSLEERIKKKLNEALKEKLLKYSENEYCIHELSPNSDIDDIEKKTRVLKINVNPIETYKDIKSDEDNTAKNVIHKKHNNCDKKFNFNDPGQKSEKTIKKKSVKKQQEEIAHGFTNIEINSKSSTTKYSFLASLSKNIPDSECDVTAKIFKKNYEENKEILSVKLFQLYNEQIFDNSIPSNTPIEWNGRMLSTAGYCYSKRKIQRNGTIERTVRIVLSSKVLSSADRLRDTLIHEMCHAAAWIVNNATGHGHHWTAWTQKAKLVFPELPPIKTCHSYEIATKYVYRCTGCGYSVRRHRKSLDIEKKRCGYCRGKFEILINKTNRKGEQETVPVGKKKEPTGFALFVRENYSNFKTKELNHGEVMKLLSKKFNELKT